jgi:hypothetical protein
MTTSGRGTAPSGEIGKPAQRGGDLPGGPLPLHQHRPDDDMAGKTVGQAMEDVADHRPGGRGDHPDHARQERQAPLARRGKQPFGLQPGLGLFEQGEQRPLARDLHPVDHDLVVRAARIGRQLAGRDNLDPVLDTKIQPPGIAAPHHPVEPGVLVLEAQVHMPRGRALDARKLAAHAHEAKAILDRALEQGRNLGNRQGRGVVASPFAR